MTRGREAFVSQHIGDLSSAATGRFYRGRPQRLVDLLDVTPELVAAISHPTIFHTLGRRVGIAAYPRATSRAHLAAVLAEHRVEGRRSVSRSMDMGLATPGNPGAAK